MSSVLRRMAILAACAIVLPSVLIPTTAAAARSEESARAKHDRIVSFWTNDKVAQAKPRDFIYNATTNLFKLAKPAAGGSSGSTTGSSWNAGGEVLKTTGKVLFAFGSSYYVCSASTVDEEVTGRSIVLTAAHCTFNETNGTFADNWMFVPDYDSAPTSLDSNGQFCATTSLGCWTASALIVHNGYASAGSFNAQAVVHDFAFSVVGAGGKTGTAQLDETVGGHPIQFSSVPGGTTTNLFGYPAAGKYKGKDLVYCKGPLGFDANMSNNTYKVTCNMTGGSSGGPWFAPFTNGSGTLVSVNSYGYSGVNAMHGPKLNLQTQAMFAIAATATGNTVVS